MKVPTSRKCLSITALIAVLGLGFPPTFVTAEDPAPAADASKPLASQELDMGDVEVKILQVQRSPGDMLMVRWEYLNKSPEKKVILQSEAGYGGFGLARSTYLIDPANKKKFNVVEDSKGTPVASKLGSFGKVEVEGGKTMKAWAKFPAPSSGVAKISVYIPGAPPFEEIPITG